MNNAFVAERARAVVVRPEIAQAAASSAKVTAIYRAILSRKPTPDEVAVGVAFAEETGKAKVTGNQLTAWEQYAQVLLLSNEFLFVD
jgi:hypothetical protein